MESGPSFRRARLTRVLGLGVMAVGFTLAGCGLLESPATTLTPRSDFGWIRPNVFDEAGASTQRRGVTGCPGLYFLGLPWLWKL